MLEPGLSEPEHDCALAIRPNCGLVCCFEALAFVTPAVSVSSRNDGDLSPGVDEEMITAVPVSDEEGVTAGRI